MAAPASADYEAWLRLANTPGIGAVTVERLLERFGDPQAVVSASDQSLKEAGVSAPARAALAEPDPAYLAAARDWLAADAAHHFISRDAARFPAALADLDPVPPWLYGLGDLDLLDRPAIAIVGSRNPSHAGRAAAYEFGQALAAAGFVVVSGLASGIDAAAHEGALAARGMTIAVTGTGLDRVYPAANRHLARQIADSGLLVSEFPLGTQPARANFPRRNRIIAGLSVATLVVEAARASGSLITARLASSAGREVFAMPGSIHNPLARGCHQLIRDGAKLVETTEHIIEEIAAVLPGYHREHVPAPANEPSTADASGEPAAADPLLEAVGFDPVRLDTLVARTGWRADEVSSRLLILELEGRIKTVAGGRYVRNA